MVTVGIVNESAAVVERLSRIVREQPNLQVVWTARNGDMALLQHRSRAAQLVLFDVDIPGGQGPNLIAKLIAVQSCVVMVVTADVQDKRTLVFAATAKGARESAAIPASEKPADTAELRRKLLMLSRLPQLQSRNAQNKDAIEDAGVRASLPVTSIIGIGASTGGPQALATVLRELPADLQAAIVIVQHLDEQFVPGLHKWLREACALPVRMAADGDMLQRGQVMLAYTQEHLVLEASGSSANVCVRYRSEPADAPHRPSIDVFFESMAALRSTLTTCGVLLTGMGRDGAAGLRRLREAGALTMAQDEESSTVYGMPLAALMAKAVDAPTLLSSIPQRLIAFSEAAR